MSSGINGPSLLVTTVFRVLTSGRGELSFGPLVGVASGRRFDCGVCGKEERKRGVRGMPFIAYCEFGVLPGRRRIGLCAGKRDGLLCASVRSLLSSRFHSRREAWILARESVAAYTNV